MSTWGVSADFVRHMLRAKTARRGEQKALAKKLKISAQFLGDVIRGNRNPNKAILDYLELEEKVHYIPKSGTHETKATHGKSTSK